MKSFSILMALSLLAPAAFAQPNLAGRVTDLTCQTQANDRVGVKSIIQDGKLVVVASHGTDSDARASVYTLTSVTTGVGDQDGLTVKADGADGELDLLLDVDGAARFYKLNGEVQDSNGVSCKLKFEMRIR
jgi:hypothetical protein